MEFHYIVISPTKHMIPQPVWVSEGTPAQVAQEGTDTVLWFLVC